MNTLTVTRGIFPLVAKRLDIATLVESGAIKRAPTRCGAWAEPAPQRVGARFIAPRARAAAMCQPVGEPIRKHDKIKKIKLSCNCHLYDIVTFISFGHTNHR